MQTWVILERATFEKYYTPPNSNPYPIPTQFRLAYLSESVYDQASKTESVMVRVRWSTVYLKSSLLQYYPICIRSAMTWWGMSCFVLVPGSFGLPAGPDFRTYLSCLLPQLSAKYIYFLDKLTIAKIIPTYKSEDRLLKNNYHPVSVLPFFFNILECLMYNRLVNYFDINKIFVDNVNPAFV